MAISTLSAPSESSLNELCAGWDTRRVFPTERYNVRMAKTQSICCLSSEHASTTLARFPIPIKCAHCDEQYFIDYPSGEAGSTASYERKVRDAAQIKINSDHPQRSVIEQLSHSKYLPIERI